MEDHNGNSCRIEDLPVYKYDNDNPQGYVYVLHPVGHSVCKIGGTNNPERRLKSFSSRFKFPVEYLYVIPCKSYMQVEQQLHFRFKDRHLVGEWFLLTHNDFAYLVEAYQAIRIKS